MSRIAKNKKTLTSNDIRVLVVGAEGLLIHTILAAQPLVNLAALDFEPGVLIP